MIKHICVECKGEFTGRKKKYCSTECSEEVRRRKNKERWRKANPGWNDGTNKVCEWCGKDFTVPARNAHIARFCSGKCKDTWWSRTVHGYKPIEERNEERRKQKEETTRIKEAKRKAKIKIKECAECGESFETIQPNRLTCSTECSRQRRNRLKWQREEKRYNDTNVIDKDISVKVLYKRDKGICYICGGECDFEDHTKTDGHFTSGPTYPSIDHLIPIARGGMHAWDNVKLAHHLCNAKKSDILPNELELDIDIDDAYALARKVPARKKEVKQYSKSMELIAVYESTAEASRQTGVKAKGIQNCARGECVTYKGYVWSYK